MPRLRLLATFFALAGLLALAPRAEAQLIPSFGVTGGVNFANLSDAATANLENSVGWHGGVYAQMGFGPIGARASLLYVRSGDLEVPGITDDPSISYIAIPIDLKYSLGLPLVDPYALLGPEARFPIGDLLDEDARSVALAVNAGIGADVGAFIGPRFFAELRYAFDVTGFFGDGIGETQTADDGVVRVNVFYLRVGIGL